MPVSKLRRLEPMNPIVYSNLNSNNLVVLILSVLKSDVKIQFRFKINFWLKLIDFDQCFIKINLFLIKRSKRALKMLIKRLKMLKLIKNNEINWIFDLVWPVLIELRLNRQILNKLIKTRLILIEFIVTIKNPASNLHWKSDQNSIWLLNLSTS